ncbi:MAG: 30S ribosomal protein S8 [Coprothermobacterota bacterium]|jgi:small subunit ribosomal protein S8|nr:30S ribosomal protein S8 [Coprothermobacterota bacterium]
MLISDPIADMLTRIRNANMIFAESTEMPSSKMKLEMARILKEEGFIKEFTLDTSSGAPIIRVLLKYGPKRDRVITGLKRVSKPGRRVYVGKDKVPLVLRGLGIAILSTSHGLMTDKTARKSGQGGEVLCLVW